MRYDDIETCEAIPEAASMIETFRAIGYSLETAIADIIDNSITAGASKIQIKRIWNGSHSVILISDNGCGMSNDELIQALRPGAQNPLETRDPKDLGRFGLGLKTASFSQCRKLSVITKKNFETNYWSWDLDYVAECKKWNLLHWAPQEYIDVLAEQVSGTCVIWSDMDRVIPKNVSADDERIKEKFSKSMEKVRCHLGMTFHRFIEDGSISIIWGSQEIEPWNPFCLTEEKTQFYPDDYLDGDVKMKGYVLPHKSHFSKESNYSKAEGPNGWNGQQGFYVYRGNRLLLAGDWLGLFRKEEHYKLARISIDLPNSKDEQWQIDIKKSKAYPPAGSRERIEQYARLVRTKAEEVYRHRGKILKQKAGRSFYPLWLDKNKDGSWSYIINRESPLVLQIKELAKQNPDEAIDSLLKIVESSLPTKTIYINESKGEEMPDKKESLDFKTIQGPLLALFNSLISQGKSKEQAKSFLKTIDPFNYFEDYIDTL